MFFFYKIAREYLSVFPAAIAFAFFALNPLMVRIATSIQPEGIMLLTYLGAVLFFLRWLRTGKIGYYWAATASTALTLLTKAPAAHIGLFFGVLLLQKFGWRAVKDPRVWLFGVASSRACVPLVLPRKKPLDRLRQFARRLKRIPLDRLGLFYRHELYQRNNRDRIRIRLARLWRGRRCVLRSGAGTKRTRHVTPIMARLDLCVLPDRGPHDERRLGGVLPCLLDRSRRVCCLVLR